MAWPGHPGGSWNALGERCRACARLPDRLRLRPSRDPLGSRRRGARACCRAWSRPRTDRILERRPGFHRRPCASGTQGPSSTLGRVKPGAIVAEGVGRSFRVYPQRNVTLKEAILRRRHLRRNEFVALRDVSLSVEPGEAVGVIGRNGSGKTTFLRLIAGIFKPSSGRLEVGGDVGSLLELGAGFHPDFTGRENVYMNAAIHGLKGSYVDERLDEIVAFAELEDFIDVPVRTYSSGMYMRLGFSVAIHLDPDILLLDEVFAVGDEAFQRKCFGKILDLRERGRTILFVSHAAPAGERLCERSFLLSKCTVPEDVPAREVINTY